MSAQHSPPPWVVAKSGVSVDAGAGSMEATRIRQERGAPQEVLEANARLIAAAPDLLAAIRRVLACGGVRSDCGAINETETALLRAALAKAGGV